MDSDGEEPTSKRPRYERSSTPIRELDPLQPPQLSPLKEAPEGDGEGEGRENGLLASDTGPAQGPAPGLDDKVLLDEDDHNDDNDQGPDYFGLSDEAMESFISEVEEEQMLGEGPQWAELPNELWQLIFQRVLLLDLVTSGRRVCQRWNQIIADEQFLHWKKMYFQLKHCDPATIATVTTILHPLSSSGDVNNQTQPNGQFVPAGNLVHLHPNYTLVHLARLFGESFPSLSSVDLEGVLSMMSKHPQYGCVSQIKEQLASDGPDLGVLAQLLLLVTCCTSVHQVLLLMELLLCPISGGFSQPALAYREMSEMFHAMATFFLFLWNKGSLPPRYHYSVFYSLDVLHRSSFVPPLSHQGPSIFPSSNHHALSPSSPLNASFSCSQESQTDQAAVCSAYSDTYGEFNDIIMTSEQSRVAVHPVQAGKTVKVIAFAGTGKTTTLVQFAKRNCHLNIGYCVYNKSVQVNASKYTFKDCLHVECKTFHSVANARVGKSYRAKGGGGAAFGNLTTYSVSRYVTNAPKLPKLNNKQSLYSFAKYIKGTLENYFASTDRMISRKHIPRFHHSDAVREVTSMLECSMVTSEDELADQHYVMRILEETRKVWNKMKDLKDSTVLMTHDGYLKLYQLSPTDFAKEERWDVLLIDEAQDLTPAIVDLVTQTTCAKIFVGDPHQQIYSFRGATNAMPLVRADHTYYLTRSFRFGPEIAYVSALLLKMLKGVKQQTLVGSTEEGCVFGTRDFRQTTIIARTNLGLFEEMAKVLRSEGGDKKKLGFVGGIKSYDFSSLAAIYYLLQGNRSEAMARHYLAKQFRSFYELQQYAEHSCDVQLQLKIKICQNHCTDLIDIIRRLEKQKVDDLSFSDVIFTTAHKSKGLQFDNVKLANDFLQNIDLQQPLESIKFCAPDDERNLLYVAASRAKSQLILSPMCIAILKKSGEHYVYPTAEAREALSETGSKCTVCGTTFSDSCPQPRLKLLRPTIKQSTSASCVNPGVGFVCQRCGHRTLKSFSFAF